MIVLTSSGWETARVTIRQVWSPRRDRRLYIVLLRAGRNLQRNSYAMARRGAIKLAEAWRRAGSYRARRVR